MTVVPGSCRASGAVSGLARMVGRGMIFLLDKVWRTWGSVFSPYNDGISIQ